MTPHRDVPPPSLAHALSTRSTPHPRSSPPPKTRSHRNSHRLVTILLVSLVVLVTLTGGILYHLGILNPFARVTTLAELPAPLSLAAYAHVAVDASGDVWVAQSAPGLASKPTDATLLTILNPNQLFGDTLQARLCLGCAGIVGTNAPDVGPALARIDDIAPDPQQPHSIYIAGWTTATKTVASQPIVLHLAWHAGAATCTAQHACATESVILTAATDVAFIGTPLHPDVPLIQQLLNIGVLPVLTLTTAPNGDLFCFMSDRGRDSLSDPQFNVVGGFQVLLRYDPVGMQWIEAYVGPGGSRNTQHFSPTSTVSAIAVDRAERYLYLADADHQTIFRMDLNDPNLASSSPFTAAGAVQRWAGQPLNAGAFGDVAQGVPGWSGDGGSALLAQLNGVRGLAFDAAGDLLVVDAGNARLRLITPQGTIWTVAGRGAPTVDGDNGAPLASGLRGMLGIATDAKNRVYLTQGAALDGTGQVRLQQLDWGWSTPRAQVTRATSGGQGFTSEVLAGLVAHNAQSTLATVLAAGSCVAHQDGCVTTFALLAGGALPDQTPLTLPQSTTQMASGSLNPMSTVQVAGTDSIVTASATPAALFFGHASGCCATAPIPSVALPTGARPTGLAVLAPTTTTQMTRLGAAYLLVATESAANGPALLIYKAQPETCGPNVTAHCLHFPGTPTLVATVPLPNQTTTGAVAVTMSDDAQHAFALIAHPMDNQVSAIDLTAWLTHRTLPQVTARIAIISPAGALAIRHDGQAAYISAGNGQLAVLDTTNWLTSGVPVNLTNQAVTVTTLGASTTQTTQLALAGDDSRLFAALQTAAGTTTMVALSIGQFDQPTAPTIVSHFASEPHLVALTLTPDAQRLLALAAPNGPQRAGALHLWVTNDPANPTQWLDTPLSLGTVPTAPDPRTLVAG